MRREHIIVNKLIFKNKTVQLEKNQKICKLLIIN
jgi:hypothetical protein